MDPQPNPSDPPAPGVTPPEKTSRETSGEHDVRLSVAAGLLTLLDMKSPQLGAHCRAVARWCRGMGVLASMSREELLELELAGLMHDLGFVVSKSILADETSAVKGVPKGSNLRHPDLGHAVLSRIDGFESISDAVLHHHERYDGQGYPLHLRGTAIPLFSRIVAVADLYDLALQPGVVSNVPDERLARRAVLENRGQSLDPELVERFVTLLNSTAESTTTAPNEMEITLRALRPGMVLARDLRSANNLLLLRAETLLTQDIINRVLSSDNTNWLTTTAFVDIRSIHEEELMRQVKREEMMLRVEMLTPKSAKVEHQKPTILVVDDFMAVCNALRRELGQEGMDVVGVTSIEAGLSVLANQRIDAVISDIAIGSTDGFSFLREVKRRYPALYCVILSGFPTPENIRALREFDNVVRFVTKPWAAPVLLSAVNEALKRTSTKEKTIV
jgi:response regulator RpfG family c-di-GMP phosphodiesterase